MKKTVHILVLICLLSLVLCGCGDSTISIGTYQNESKSEEQIIITETTIQFVNVSLEDFSEKMYQELGLNLNMTDYLSCENAYTTEDGVLKIEIVPGLSISFNYGNNYISVNEEIFKLCYN